MATILITGSSGLIGSQCVEHFCERGDKVWGIDNDMRSYYFGKDASTASRGKSLIKKYLGYRELHLSVADRQNILSTVKNIAPDVIIHTAAQPSHDWAAKEPFTDFDVNAGGTLNLLEGARQCDKRPIFVHMSTNKVYGDNPNKLPLIEKHQRYDFRALNTFEQSYPGPVLVPSKGVNEEMSLDHCKHSLFGVSKTAADLYVQEYGKYFGMNTVCLRGGCLTGPNHSGAEAHGFLSYLIKCCKEEKKYVVYGYKGKQVRDNIHAYDVVKFIEAFIESPRMGETYNIGGGRENSCSILEAIALAEEITGKRMNYEIVDIPREGDHICYISDLTKCKSHYPQWGITKDLRTIFTEIANGKG